MSQAELADRIGITQPAVSYALRQLGPLVTRTAGGWTAADRTRLFRYAEEEYPGPGGISTFWWHDGTLEEQLQRVSEAATVLVSGDLAARRIHAWRKPEHVVLYTADDVDLAAVGFAMASPDDYTLELTLPADGTIWSTAELFRRPGLADPVIIARDIRRTGTTGDEDEAADAIARETIG